MYKAYIGEILEYMGRVGRPLTTNEIKDYINETTSYGTSSSEVKSTLKSYQILFRKVGKVRIKSDSGCYEVETWTLTGAVEDLQKTLKSNNVRTLKRAYATNLKLSGNNVMAAPDDEDEDEHEPIFNEYDEDDERLDINGKLRRDEHCNAKEEEPDPILMPKTFRRQRRVKWTPEMDIEFARYRLAHNMSEADIALKMGLRITQVKGRIKRLENGKLPKAVMALQEELGRVPKFASPKEMLLQKETGFGETVKKALT